MPEQKLVSGRWHADEKSMTYARHDVGAQHHSDNCEDKKAGGEANVSDAVESAISNDLNARRAVAWIAGIDDGGQ